MGRRICDYGIEIGLWPKGRRNKITDVPGVTVGHKTLCEGEIRTGVTVILPVQDNIFLNKCTAAAYVHNGFGKTCGLLQVEELGTLETPIALTNTLNVGLAADALVEYTLKRCREDGAEALSVNPVVGECNDSRMNRISRRAVKKEDVFAAIEAAGEDFEEGGVGAGAGTVCYGFKGGIGSASRVVTVGGREYTIGVLVQSNFGATRSLMINGAPVGREILRAAAAKERDLGAASSAAAPYPSDAPVFAAAPYPSAHPMPRLSEAAREAVRNSLFRETAEDRGSIMMICATDLPLSERQLKRLIRRMGNGLARTGSYTGHGSGEIMIGFTTANRVPDGEGPAVQVREVLSESLLNDPFQAVAEAVEEAVLNSMTMASTAPGLDGTVYYSLNEFL